MIRHAALCLTTIAVFAMRHGSSVDVRVLWIIGAATLLNTAAFAVAGRRKHVWIGSFFLAVPSWAALAHLTGGLSSPIVAGLCLEILLSAEAGWKAFPLLVALTAIVCLWLQEALPGGGGSIALLVLQTGLLAAMGGMAYVGSLKWSAVHGELEHQRVALQSRLATVEGELSGLRAFSRLGEDHASLVHGLKNTVHSLRGLTRLLERDHARGRPRRAVVDGLGLAVDQLELLVQERLARIRTPNPMLSERTHNVRGVIEAAVSGTERSHPAVSWSRCLPDDLPHLEVPAEVVREVISILADNAAEAMSGRGKAEVRAGLPNEGVLEVEILDRGPGLEPHVLGRFFEPGFTTKPHGNGVGLALARRLLDPYGAGLSVQVMEGGGTRFTVRLPVEGAER